MDNFDYKKYLAEGRLLKETKEKDYYNLLMDLGGTELAGDTFEDMMYKRGEYVSFEDFLDDELDFFQKEGDVEVINKIKSTFLNENVSLDVNVNEEEAHKHTYKQIDPDGTAECTKCGLRNSDPSKTGEKVNEGSTPSIEDVRLYIQKELGRAGEQDAGLDAYIDSIQRDFAAGRDAYDDYEMDDYLEDFENYIADKMDY